VDRHTVKNAEMSDPNTYFAATAGSNEPESRLASHYGNNILVIKNLEKAKFYNGLQKNIKNI
jgi:hypothetical protein